MKKSRHLIVFLFYGTLAGLVMNMLALHPTTHVPGPNSDFYQFHWNFWWIRHALFEVNQSVFFTDFIHFPFEQNLAFHTLTVTWFPIYLAFEPILGQIFVVNLMFWLSITLSGYTTFVFLRAEAISISASLIGGIVLITSAYLIFHIWESHLNIMALFWLPVMILLWKQVLSQQSWYWSVMLGLALWVMWLTDTQWLLWAAFLLVPYGLLTLLTVTSFRTGVRVITLGLLSISIMMTLSYALGPLRQMLAFQGEVQPATLETARHWSLPLTALWGENGTQDQNIGHILLPLTGLAIFAPSQFWRRWWWFGIGGIALIMALGPDIPIANHSINLPYHWLHKAFGGMYRAPSRFIPIILLALSAFIGLSFHSWISKLSKAERGLVVGVICIALIGDGRVFRPIPTYIIPDYAVYHDIGKDSAAVVLIEVPLGVANGWNTVGKARPIEQYYGIYHHKQMVNGFVAREPSNNYLFYELSPLWNWLAGNIALNPDAVNLELTKYLHDWPIGYLIIHQADFGRDHPKTLEWIQFFNSHPDFCQIAVEKDVLVYRTVAHPKGCIPQPRTKIDIGSDDWGAIGFGWYWVEGFGGRTSRWMGESASLYFDLPPHQQSITIEAIAFHEPSSLEIIANGQSIATITVSNSDWQIYTVTYPAVEGPIHLHLLAHSVYSPADLGLSGDTRQLSVAVSLIEFK